MSFTYGALICMGTLTLCYYSRDMKEKRRIEKRYGVGKWPGASTRPAETFVAAGWFALAVLALYVLLGKIYTVFLMQLPWWWY